MNWNKKNQFQRVKKPSSKFKYDPKKNELYIQEFLNDWMECRTRHEAQQEILDAIFEQDCQYVFARAGRKLAKTTTGIDASWRVGSIYPNAVIYLCYPTIAQGIEVVWEERRLQTCDSKNDYMFEKYVEKVDEVRHTVRFVNGSFIKLMGTWSDYKGRGTQPDFLIFDEFQDCKSDYIEAVDPNLGAKAHSKCIIMGTPPKKRNHYEDWFERIANNPRGKSFHYTSYANTSLPHLKKWLDNKKIELVKAGKEDVWLREYMAEFCYSSSDRVLPDAKFYEKSEIDQKARYFAYNDRIPILAISVHKNYFCCILAVLLKRKLVFVMDHLIVKQVWNQSFAEMYPKLSEKTKELQDFCHQKMRRIVWDESNSFTDIISGFSKCRKDFKWQDRGIPILKEMMMKEKIFLCEEIADFGIECQNILIDESDKEIERNYPYICTLSMMVNEYFSQEKIFIHREQPFDKYQALRDMGIPVPVQKKRRSIFNFGL